MSKYIKGKERMKHEKKKNVVHRTPQTEKRENKKENNNKHNLILKEGKKMLIKLSECIAPFGEGN